MATDKRFPIVDIENQGADREFDGFPMREQVGFDGQNLQRLNASNMAVKITVVGTTTYVAQAAPGTPQSTAKWKVMKIDESSGTVITWADGDADFDNVATDLTTLNYL